MHHLLIECVVAKQVWFHTLSAAGRRNLMPNGDTQPVDWWLAARNNLPKEQKRGLDTLVILVCWLLWKERNARVFSGKYSALSEILERIRHEGLLWSMA